ncbi:hypothetical protein [Bacillus coahuilensis]
MCDQGHEWEQSPNSRQSAKCKECQKSKR